MHTQSSKWKRLSLLVTSLAAAAFLLQGCGGSDGDTGPAGPAGAAGATGATGAPGKDLTAKVSLPSNSAAASADAAAAWAALAPQVTVTGVTIASPPVVKFTVKDANGNPIVGLGNKSQSTTAQVAGLTNLAFTLAKLVPGTNNEPSKWVSYNVLRLPTVAEKAGTVAATTSCDSTTAPTWCGTYPTTDTQGTLVDNGDGSYQYTFLRDPKQVATLAANLIDTANGLNKKADFGDLTFDPTLTHRVGIQLGGAAPGTGSNTPNAVTVTPSVNMVNTANVVYDFRPDGAAVTNTRDIVKIDSCAGCHNGKVLAHGSRKDPKYCMTCHTDQIRYSFSMEAPATGYTLTGGTTGTTAQKRAETAVVDGRAIGNFPNFMHKLHMGDELVKKGYNYNANGGAMMFNEVLYPQPRTNCTKCHDGSASAVNKTADGDNWKKVPSRLACGACHDGINFATGQGVTLAGDTHGHVGGAKADDKLCVLCHDATNIPIYHVTNDPSPSAANSRAYYLGQAIPISSQLNMPAGVYKIAFEIRQVTVTGAAGAKKAKVVFRVMKDGAPATLNATGYLMDNVDGSPSIYVGYGVPQDGITTPVDWNTSISATLKAIRDTNTAGNTLTGPDASGYYTASFGATIPDTATMVTGAMGINYGGFVQLNHASYPKGIMLREAQFAMKTADGYTARRSIVSNAKCNNCHGQLGVSPTFHGGARNNGEGCALCHTPNNATGHVGAANSFGGGWSVAIKNLVHGIHGASKREQAYSYEATAANPLGFDDVGYPGVLSNCEQCHVAGSYDFSASANAAAVPNLLWTTDARGDMSNPTNAASIGLSPWVPAQTSYTVDNLVSSPVASSCFGCHDSKAAVAHMRGNGGTIVSLASSVGNGVARPVTTTTPPTNGAFKFTQTEACMVCHGSGKVADIKAAHIK
ncbi:MAG: OmcA/MtrC family decaheme c-type cytochrome [Sterolibacterium sp.]